MDYTEAREQLIWNFRLDFDPVGVRFITDESEADRLPVTHKAKSRLSYCQHLAAVRQARHVLLMRPDDCPCRNAQPVFGFRELDRESDTKMHMKYFQDPELSWQAASNRAGLDPGTCRGVYMAPLDWFDRVGTAPDVVFILCVPYQAYHILNDYMGATKRPNLSFFQTPTSAVCSGSIWAYKNKTANMTTMCSGSKTSGKTEMNYMNLFIPGEHILTTVMRLAKRCQATGGPSLLGQGGQPWPGLDVCNGCPVVRFGKIQ